MTGDEKRGPAATSTLDALWVLYDRVLRVGPERVDDPERTGSRSPRGTGLRRAAEVAGADVVLVEPYPAGTSTPAAGDALADVSHRVLGLVGRRELRRYGTSDEHLAAHGLDAAALRERIGGFLGASGRPRP